MQSWRLDDRRQTLVLAARRDRLPEVIYWGPPLPASESTAALAAAHMLDVTGGMLDENPDLSICPEAVRTFPGQPGMIVRGSGGAPILPANCYQSVSCYTLYKAIIGPEIENYLIGKIDS